MGQKVHPTGFRIGVIYDWQSKWFADHGYHTLLQEDLVIRNYVDEHLSDASISRVEIERNANQVTVTVHTAKPGIVIGRGGQKVDELRSELEQLTGKRIRVNIQEIRMPELDARLVARNIAEQLERRVAFRRALKQTVSRTMQRGAEGCKATVAGRLGGAEMSRRESSMDGRVPLHTLRANIDFGVAEAHTTFGRIGVKVWIYKGETLPEKHERTERTGQGQSVIDAIEARASGEGTAAPEGSESARAEKPAPATEITPQTATAPEASAPPEPAATAPPPEAEAAEPKSSSDEPAAEPAASSDEATGEEKQA